MLLNKRISVLYFISQIKSQLLLLAVFAVTVGILDNHAFFKSTSLPLNIAAILGTAVSLLLGFRTAQSYERWWEARIVWGAIVNDSRTLIRQIVQFLPASEKNFINTFSERQIIWVYALGESLRRQPFSQPVKVYLDRNGITALNVPNALLDAHSDDIAKLVDRGLLTEFRQVQVNETILRLCESMGKCERIKNTVFPRAYSLLLHTLIYVFAATLPFGLDDSQLVLEILVTFSIPVIFVSIERTAIMMQDPFENTPVDTPVTALAQTIELNIREMLGEKGLKPIKPSDTYFQM